MDDDDSVQLIEVFNIIYLGKNADEVVLESEKQRGIIKICSDSGVQYVYKVEVPDLSQPPLKPGDDIVVTVKGPTCSYMETIYLKYDLFGGAYKGSICIDWEPQYLNEVFASELCLRSTDGYGKIVVLTGQYANATVANLEVKLPDNFAAAKVYGVIAATNSKLDIPKYTSLLFLKKPENPIQAGDKGVIPLSKSHVAVPINSVLHVDISLNVNGNNHTTSLSFDAKKEGESTQGADMIEVKVTWYADENKIITLYDKVNMDSERVED